VREHFPHVWTQTGGILTFDHKDHARDYVARAERMGVAIKRLTRDAVIAQWPQLASLQIAAAVYVPSDGIIDIAALLGAYSADARVMLETSVEHIADSGHGATLTTNRGVVDARVVVDATGAWAGAATGDPLLDSFKRHVYVLEAAAPTGAPYVWHLGGCELYVRAIGDRILISPCDATQVPPGDQEPDRDGEALLRARLDGSSLAAAPVWHAWACQRTFPRKLAMKIERDEQRPWLVWAAGLGGHGATASSAVGLTAAAHVINALER